jgi:hypothetical protein
MNLLTIIPAISALVAYITATPINNYNTTAIKNITNSQIQSNISLDINKTNNNVSIYNITTSIPSIITTKSITNIRCNWMWIDRQGYPEITNTDILHTLSYFKTKTPIRKRKRCKSNVEGCYIQILFTKYRYYPYSSNINIFTHCRYNNKKKKKIANTNWFLQFLDYDSYEYYRNYKYRDTFSIRDYCKGDLCNSPDLKNFPNAKKLLSIKAKNPTQHNELCPGYSKNYRKIALYVGKVQQISVAEGANLILLARGIRSQWPSSYSRPPYYYNSPYDKTEWTLATLEDPGNDMPFISFDKNNNVIAYDIPHNLIANNKTFYLSPKSIHICNFTKEDQGILKHIDRFENNKTLVYEVKIIIWKKPTTIPTTTKEPTTISTTKGDYTSTKNNNIKYIIGSVASGFILCIVTITIYCVVKNKTCKRQVAHHSDTLMLIPLK